MHGLHLTADLHDCADQAPAMTEPDALRTACLQAVREAGLHPVGELFHRFTPWPGSQGPGGITGVVLLAESHLAVHTWPELRAVTLDVYVCNVGQDNSTRAQALLDAVSRLFAPQRLQIGRLQRGVVSAASEPQPLHQPPTPLLMSSPMSSPLSPPMPERPSEPPSLPTSLPTSAPRLPMARPATPPRALILAAGRGERMRPLTDTTPKPLLAVRGQPLISYHLQALAAAGVREVVINTAWLEDQFPAALGDGSRWGLRLHYSMEGRDHGGALETAGGIAKALPLLAPGGDEAFWVVSGDVFLPGFAFEAADAAAFAASPLWGQLWLVPNAPHHPQGDFGISPQGLAVTEAAQKLTWASVGLFKPALVAGVTPGTRLALRPRLDAAIAAQRLGARRWDGPWTDVGTVARLDALNARMGS